MQNYSPDRDPLDLPTLDDRLKWVDSHSVDLPALGEPAGVASIQGIEMLDPNLKGDNVRDNSAFIEMIKIRLAYDQVVVCKVSLQWSAVTVTPMGIGKSVT